MATELTNGHKDPHILLLYLKGSSLAMCRLPACIRPHFVCRLDPTAKTKRTSKTNRSTQQTQSEQTSRSNTNKLSEQKRNSQNKQKAISNNTKRSHQQHSQTKQNGGVREPWTHQNTFVELRSCKAMAIRSCTK